MAIKRPRGTQDFLPEQIVNWHYIEQHMREICKAYGFSEIRTPAFEDTKLFLRGIGETTDVVSKEMYTFSTGDDKEQSYTLRPENTASAVRAYLENKVYGKENLTKWFYMGSMFRHDKPQAGRYREFHQFGVECFGAKNPAIDVEIIAMAQSLFEQIGISGVTLHLNSLGDLETRKAYRTALVDYLTPFEKQLSKDSQRRLHENPLRVLDSKEKEDKEIVKDAPSILDFLTEESQNHFDMTRDLLDGLGIEYVIDTNMVRGLDYYNDTIFEFIVDVKGQELTVCAGGRYDGLVEYFDGPATPGFGFGLGVERLLMVAEMQGVDFHEEDTLDVYIAVMGNKASLAATQLAESLRAQAFKVERDFSNRKLSAQFKSAEKAKAEVIITLGDNEVETGEITVKHNQTRKEVKTTLAEVAKGFAPIFEEALGE